mgnify:CR=1 FL=1
MDFIDKRRLQRKARHILEVLAKNGYDVEKYKAFLPVLEERFERERAANRKYARAYHASHRAERCAKQRAYYATIKDSPKFKARNIARVKEYIKTHPEKIRERNKRYYIENRERILKKTREYAKAHKQEKREYDKRYQASPAYKRKKKERMRKYCEAHREELLARSRARRNANKEAVNAYKREWRAKRRAAGLKVT